MAGRPGRRAVADPLGKLREICLALPDVVEGEAWGHPVWRVGKSLFAGYGLQGRWCVNVKLEEPHADLLRNDPRLVSTTLWGRNRWVSLEAAKIEEWAEIADMVLEGYRMSAGKRSLAKLGDRRGQKE
ncbi:MAG: MmcQ/YjbR family DNA-binding protein [Chloroflexota bacterium]